MPASRPNGRRRSLSPKHSKANLPRASSDRIEGRDCKARDLSHPSPPQKMQLGRGHCWPQLAQVTTAVLSLGHFSGAKPGQFRQAPKAQIGRSSSGRSYAIAKCLGRGRADIVENGKRKFVLLCGRQAFIRNLRQRRTPSLLRCP
jgi:hypothetical protein